MRLLSARRLRSAGLEDILLVATTTAATIYAEYPILSDQTRFPHDFTIHTFWMRRFQDPALFRDPLTEALLDAGFVPAGLRFLYWLASHVVDPVTFGQWLPILLAPLSAWLLFRIVRMHSTWKPAAWLAVGLFLLPWDLHRFSGGHARAFMYPVVLGTVFMALRKRDVAAAIVAPAGTLLYPPAGILAVATFGLSSLGWRAGRPDLNLRRAGLALISAILVGAAAIGPAVVTGSSARAITRSEAVRYPEFGKNGQWRFFGSPAKKFLKKNYTGFRLRESGSIVVVAGILLLLLLPRNAMILRKEVWAMAAASLLLFGLAHAFLFALYLPHRYTYPLLPFFSAVIGVSWKPTWKTMIERRRAWVLWVPLVVLFPVAVAILAWTLFPLGPEFSWGEAIARLGQARIYLGIAFILGLLVALVGHVRSSSGPAPGRTGTIAIVAIVAGALLIAEVAWPGGLRSGSSGCGQVELYRYLQTVPKDAVVAGDPLQMSCVPLAARRSVLISEKLYQPWNVAYFSVIRERMFVMIRAYYGASMKRILDLRRRYGADYLVVREENLTSNSPPRRWRLHRPFTPLIARLLQSNRTPAALDLPRRCRTWQHDGDQVFDLGCVARLHTGTMGR